MSVESKRSPAAGVGFLLRFTGLSAKWFLHRGRSTGERTIGDWQIFRKAVETKHYTKLLAVTRDLTWYRP
jgi:hypothetical protein